MRAIVLEESIRMTTSRPEPSPVDGEALVRVTCAVVSEINCSCWRCPTCVDGFPTHCPNRTVLGILNHDGAFADLIAVPQRNLHLVPDSVPDEVAVFTEPVAAAFQIPAQLTIRPADRVIVLGDGRL